MPVVTGMFHPGGSADVVKLEAAKVIAGPISLSFPFVVGNSGNVIASSRVAVAVFVFIR